MTSTGFTSIKCRFTWNKVVNVLIQLSLIIIISRFYKFLPKGELLFPVLIILALLDAKIRLKIGLNQLILTGYFALFGLAGIWSGTQDILFYKAQLSVLFILLILSNNPRIEFDRTLEILAILISTLGIILYFFPDLYRFYNFNNINSGYFTFHGINFPNTFSLVRAASSFGSSNELGAFLSVFLLYKNKQLNKLLELLIIIVILLTQSRTAYLLLFFYELYHFKPKRLLYYSIIILGVILVLSTINLKIDDILEISRVFGKSTDTSLSTGYRIEAITKSLNSGFYPWAASNNTITPHSIWFFHIDQFGILMGMILNLPIIILLNNILLKTNYRLLFAFILITLTEPNLLLLPSFIFITLILSSGIKENHYAL